MQLWLIQGCGVSAVCSSIAGLEFWTSEIIKRGGFPTVQRLLNGDGANEFRRGVAASR